MALLVNQAWLENPLAIRTILVQVDTAIPKFLSIGGLTVSSQFYSPVLVGNFNITNSIGIDYTSNISYSDIEINNPNGELDSWLTEVWTNKAIRVYFGDATWTALDNFKLVFSGVVGDIDSKSREVLNITIRDSLQKINTSITENKLGNYNPLTLSPYTNPNSEVIKPLIFGEVFNITPLLTSSQLLEYMVNDGAVEQIIEVRDNGVPVLFTTTAIGLDPVIPPGSFRLLHPAVGTITVSAQGMKLSTNLATGALVNTYVNNVVNIIATIILQYGKNTPTIDLTTFTVAASTTAPGNSYVGIYTQDRFNVFSICNDLAKSAGMYLYSTIDGKIGISQLTIPGSSTATIDDTYTILNSLNITSKPEVVAAQKLGYAKNWTVQDNLITGIPEAHKETLAREWLEVNIVDTTVKTDYNITSDAELEPTYLVDLAQATAIATTKLTFRKSRRIIFSLTATSKFLEIAIGSAITLTSSRFGLSAGVLGRVISTSPNWINGTIDLEVLI